MSRIAIVTATIDFTRAYPCIQSWLRNARQSVPVYIVEQGTDNRDWEQRTLALPAEIAWPSILPATKHRAPQFRYYQRSHREILGVVPAFALGVEQALRDGHEVIACFHDDLEIEGDGWDEDVFRLFRACPRAGLCGFGGARGLGSDDIYQAPYTPMQLVRQNFGSNMRHAEAHGARWTAAQPVAVLDGFSQIGLASYWRGKAHPHYISPDRIEHQTQTNLFEILKVLGVVHHAYDAALGAFAKQLGYQVWFVPVPVHHHGGLTAVADPRYHEWANQFTLYNALEQKELRGDAAYWTQAHQIVYELFRSVLPIRT